MKNSTVWFNSYDEYGSSFYSIAAPMMCFHSSHNETLGSEKFMDCKRLQKFIIAAADLSPSAAVRQDYKKALRPVGYVGIDCTDYDLFSGDFEEEVIQRGVKFKLNPDTFPACIEVEGRPKRCFSKDEYEAILHPEYRNCKTHLSRYKANKPDFHCESTKNIQSTLNISKCVSAIYRDKNARLNNININKNREEIARTRAEAMQRLNDKRDACYAKYLY